jgi:predicted PhzF superfamily epimerase YddE/YHI9
MKLFVVDAFTDTPFSGNPAGVVLVDQEQDSRWMQLVAAELRHSETAFVAKGAGSGWNLRWFTPTTEVDLCGHATLAAAHVLGRESVFHTRSGPLACNVSSAGLVEMDFPADPPKPIQDPDILDRALGDADVAAIARGVSDLLVELRSPEDVRQLRPDFDRIARIPVRGLIATACDHERNRIVSRCFYPAVGVPEDPVTGSAHCTIGGWWYARLGWTTFIAEQHSSRGGVINVSVDGDRVRLAGKAVTVWSGEFAV